MATNNTGGEVNSTPTPPKFPFSMPPLNQVSTDLRLNIRSHSDGLYSHMNKPNTSFTSLLLGPDPEPEPEEVSDHSALVKQYTQSVNDVVSTQAEIMRCTLEGLWDRQHNTLIKAVKESESKKLKGKEAEIKQLEEEVAYRKTEAQFWKGRAETLEVSLKAAMRKLQASGEGTSGGASRRKRAAVLLEEDATSSHVVDSGKEEPVKLLACKLCKSHVATLMVWPCHHVCMCIGYDPLVKVCMVCHKVRLF